MITNRGIKVWPDGFEETFVLTIGDRFKPDGDAEIDKTNIIELLLSAINENIDAIKTETYTHLMESQDIH
jgi:isocitrate dehydrogenase